MVKKRPRVKGTQTRPAGQIIGRDRLERWGRGGEEKKKPLGSENFGAKGCQNTIGERKSPPSPLRGKWGRNQRLNRPKARKWGKNKTICRTGTVRNRSEAGFPGSRILQVPGKIKLIFQVKKTE